MKVEVVLGIGSVHAIRHHSSETGLWILVIERLEFWSEKEPRTVVSDVGAIADALAVSLARDESEWWTDGLQAAKEADEHLSCLLVHIVGEFCTVTAIGQIQGTMFGGHEPIDFRGNFHSISGIDVLRSTLGSSEVEPQITKSCETTHICADFRDHRLRDGPQDLTSLIVVQASKDAKFASFELIRRREPIWSAPRQ